MSEAIDSHSDSGGMPAPLGGVSRRGDGPRHIIYLHGYGQHGEVYADLVPSTPEFTHHFFDLPFHGADDRGRPHEPPLSVEVLADDMRGYLRAHCVGRPCVLAYSMGARVILSLFPHLCDLLGDVHLLAPDGLYRSAWYRAAVGSAFGRMIFRGLVSRWRMAQRWAEALTSMGVMSQSHLRLLRANIQNDEMAERLVRTWSYMREVQPDLSVIRQYTAQEGVSILWLHLGRHDRVIVTEKVLSSIDRNEILAKVVEHETGHRLLRSVIIAQIFSRLRTPPNS